MTKTEEALRKEVDRLGDHISDQGREIARLVNENHKLKRELADTRTSEGQEMWAVMNTHRGHIYYTGNNREHLEQKAKGMERVDISAEVVPVLVTKKED